MSDVLRFIKNRPLNGAQLSRLHTFEAAARHQSFAQAAGEMSLTPSAVSHQINQLEQELGIALFVRSHRKVTLTPDGKRIYWAMKSSLDALNGELLDIKNQALSGSLSIYSRPSIAQCWLVPALGEFAKLHPSIVLNILTGNEAINFQQTGIDLAIYFDDRRPDSLTRHYLMDEFILPVCSPDYALRMGLHNNPPALRHCALLHDRQAWNKDCGEEEWLAWAGQFDVSLPVGPGIGFDRSDLAMVAALHDVGIAMGRRRLVQQRLQRGELIAPFGDRMLACHQHYYVITLSNRNWPKIDAFINWLKSIV